MAVNEIADKSKGDALSKIIFILPTCWFILQCLARRLYISQLDHTTVPLVSLNGITFIFWCQHVSRTCATANRDSAQYLSTSSYYITPIMEPSNRSNHPETNSQIKASTSPLKDDGSGNLPKRRRRRRRRRL